MAGPLDGCCASFTDNPVNTDWDKRVIDIDDRKVAMEDVPVKLGDLKWTPRASLGRDISGHI